jgi:rubrerythrin
MLFLLHAGRSERARLRRPEWFICEKCGHVLIPEDPDFKCSCRNCLEMKRAA